MNIAGRLPAYQKKKLLIVKKQDAQDIVSEVLQAHKLFAPDYDKVAKLFWKGNVYETCRNLWYYCKDNFPYKVESDENQTTRSPSAMLATARSMGVDCKHYAGFVAGILSALGRGGKPIECKYRFASYDPDDSTAEHVFVVANDDEGEIWVDPVLNEFNTRYPNYFYKFDKKISNTMLNRLSGIQNYGHNIGAIDIDWDKLLSGLLTAGVSVVNAQQQIALAKQQAANAAALGQQYVLPGTLQQYYPQNSMSQYMPFIIGGAAILAILLLRGRR